MTTTNINTLANTHNSPPNCLHIKINKQEKYDDGEFYKASRVGTTAAYQDLHKSAALGLYLYFNMNKNNFELDLFRVHVEKEMGIKKTAYYDALQTLKEKGYLVLRENQFGEESVYDFYEIPRPKTN